MFFGNSKKIFQSNSLINLNMSKNASLHKKLLSTGAPTLNSLASDGCRGFFLKSPKSDGEFMAMAIVRAFATLNAKPSCF